MPNLGIISSDLLPRNEQDWIFVSINPDLCNSSGHYLYFDQSLRKAVASLGGKFISFANKAFTVSHEHYEDWIDPVFSQKTVVSTWEGSVSDRMLFVSELRDALARLAERLPATHIVAFLYSGHSHQLPLVVQAMADFPSKNLTFIFNFYSAYFDFQKDSEENQRGLLLAEKSLRFCSGLQSTNRVVVVSDGVYVADLVKKYLRKECPIIPFFCLNPPSSDEQKKSPATDRVPDTVTVSYLGFAQEPRGFTLLLDAVRECLSQNPAVRWKFVIRTGTNDYGIFEGIIPEQIRLLEELGAEVFSGYLDENEMERRYQEADILLIPYQARYFAHRTSAHTSDALAHGLAIVATAGTWSGQLVEKLQAGITFRDGDARSLGQAILQTAANLTHFKSNSIVNGADWLSRNNCRSLVEFLRSHNAPAREDIPSDKTEWELLTLATFNSYYSGLLLGFLTGLNASDILPDHAIPQISGSATQIGQPQTAASYFSFLNLCLNLQRNEVDLRCAIHNLKANNKRLEEKKESLLEFNRNYREKIKLLQEKIANLNIKIEKLKSKKHAPKKTNSISWFQKLFLEKN